MEEPVNDAGRSKEGDTPCQLRDTQNWRTDFYCEHHSGKNSRIATWFGVRDNRYTYANYYEDSLPLPQQLGLLRAYALVLERLGNLSNEQRNKLIAKLDPLLPAPDANVCSKVLRLLTYLRAPSAAAKGMQLLADRGLGKPVSWNGIEDQNATKGSTLKQIMKNPPPTVAIEIAFTLSHVREGWTTGIRKWTETPASLQSNGQDWTATANTTSGATAWFMNAQSGDLIVSSEYQETNAKPSVSSTEPPMELESAQKAKLFARLDADSNGTISSKVYLAH